MEYSLKLIANKYNMEVKYRDKSLSEQERIDVVSRIDELITEYSESIRRYHTELLHENCPNEELVPFLKLLSEIGEYTLRVVTDCVVLQKYFLLATCDYEKALFRGKLQVILNEGFKHVFWFKNSKKKSTLWSRLSEFVSLFPDSLKEEYQKLQEKLDGYSYDSWWMDERNSETHLDIAALYVSREVPIIEAKVIMESMGLINILLDVHKFMTDLHGSYCEYLRWQYLKQQRNK